MVKPTGGPDSGEPSAERDAQPGAPRGIDGGAPVDGGTPVDEATADAAAGIQAVAERALDAVDLAEAATESAEAAAAAAADASAADAAENPLVHSRELIHAQLRATRADIERQVQATRAQLDQVSERIEARTGRNLILAVLIGLALGGILLVSLIVWKDLFSIVALVFVGFTTFEFVTALAGTPRKLDAIPNVLAAVALIAAAHVNDPVAIWATLLGGIAFAIVWRLLAQMREADGRTAPEVLRDVMTIFLVQAYVPFMAAFAVMLTRQEGGEWWTLAFVAIVVSVDVGAYASGLSFGKHPMAPKISPKKTWEGLAGAVIAAQVAGVLLAIFMLEVPWWVGSIFAVLLVTSATLGDLAESLIKRDIGIKDMSSWLPGHGGFLDRLDSMLPSAPLAFAMFMIFSPLALG